MTNNVVLNELKDTDFKPLINHLFSTSANGAVMQSFELLEVSLLGSKPINNKRHAFSLIFRSENDQTPVQNMHQLEHEALGQLELFLVPVGPDKNGMLFEAVFT